MARRGRRQVLQLDDVSSSHSPRSRGFAPTPSEEVNRKMTSNPLLSLVGYTSDASSDEDSDDNDRTPPSSSAKRGVGVQDEQVLEIPLPVEAEPLKGPELQSIPEPPVNPEPVKGPDLQEAAEPSVTAESVQEGEPPALESMLDIPLPESSGPTPGSQAVNGGTGSGMESELANFFAEIKQIESTTAENAPPDTEEASLPTTSDLPSTNEPPAVADSSQPEVADLGFIPRPDASVSPAPEERKPTPPAEEKAKSASSAYRSMFVKGASEFVKMEKEEKKENGEEVEELPEEPVSDWQMVQDDATGYYYYWNMVTNQVTWEIPPDYTQFLLLHKEYQERLAAIPKDKLQRMMEKKKQGDSSGRESSPAPSSSRSKKEKKHKRDKHRKEKSEPTSSLPAVEIGPQLPPMPAEDSSAEVSVSADQSDAGTTDEVRTTVSPRPSSEDGKEEKTDEALDSAADSTSVSLPQDVEAIFDEALSVVSESHADSSKCDKVFDMFKDNTSVAGQHVMPVVTSSSVMEVLSLTPSMDVTTSSAAVDSSKSISAESSKSGSPTPAEGDAAMMFAGAGANTSVVSSSSVVSSVSLLKKDSKGDSGEGMVTNSGVNDGGLPEEEENDRDVDFDDLDDIDRALEEALEKKLEKKKAELQKLENHCEEDMMTPDSHPLSSPAPTHSSQSDNSEHLAGLASAEAESTVSSSVKATAGYSHVTAPSSRSSSSAASDKDGDDSVEGRSDSSRPKRSAAESSTKDDNSRRLEPVAKKARLVAYEAAETDEESMDASEEVSTTPAESMKTLGDVNSVAEVLPTPPPELVDNLSEIEDMANTACAKLTFLEVTVEGLTPLQTSLIALQTRMMDWQKGGLNGEYFYQRLKEVNDLLTHYESRAVPPGWSCQWDSNFRRYFYIRESTGRTQWEYPDVATEEAPKMEERKSRKGKSSKKKRSKMVGPEPMPASSAKTAPVEESEAAEAAYPDGTAALLEGPGACQDGVAGHHDGVDEDVDGVAMSKEEIDQCELQQVNGENFENQPSTSTDDPTQREAVPSALQALFPGEPLPPGTELLLGLPPPPPPPLPADETDTTATTTTTTITMSNATTEDAYTCADDSSDEGSEKLEDRGKERSEVVVDLPHLDPDIDGEEMVEEEEEEEGGGLMERRVEDEDEDMRGQVIEDPAVISRPPQLRFPPAVASGAVAFVSSSSGVESSSTVSAPPVLSATPVLNTPSGQPLPDSASGGGVTSPKLEERQRSSRSPAPSHEPSSSSGGDHHKRDKTEKHKKKKKEKLGSHTMSLKKKGVSTMLQNWQKVQKEVEKEERANQQRQMAIRQQLDEWKKGNS